MMPVLQIEASLKSEEADLAREEAWAQRWNDSLPLALESDRGRPNDSEEI